MPHLGVGAVLMDIICMKIAGERVKIALAKGKSTSDGLDHDLHKLYLK